MVGWKARGRRVGPEDRPLVMGIINVTPDSFADGGRFGSIDRVLARAAAMVRAGADLLDVGGESSRPGSEPIAVETELARVIPVLEALKSRIDAPMSVDTTKPEVARAAIEAGAAIINDIRGCTDPAMIEVVAASDVGVIVMHMRGTPRTMQDAPHYEDVVREVVAYLHAQVEVLNRAGIGRERVAIDPGIGFGKTFDHNIALLRHFDHLGTIGCPVLVGTSRKGFLGKITGKPVDEREAASVASALAACVGGASIVRVHDVGPTVDALRVWGAQVGWGSVS